MRIRASFVLCVPIVTVLVTGCADTPPPVTPQTSAPKLTIDTPVGGSSKRVLKKKDPKAFNGPTDVVQ